MGAVHFFKTIHAQASRFVRHSGAAGGPPPCIGRTGRRAWRGESPGPMLTVPRTGAPAAVWTQVLRDAGFTQTAFYAHGGLWVACIGATGQGLVTLEAGIMHRIQRGLAPGLQSAVHQIIALFFFLGSAAHCYAFTYALWQCPSPALARLVQAPSRYVQWCCRSTRAARCWIP